MAKYLKKKLGKIIGDKDSNKNITNDPDLETDAVPCINRDSLEVPNHNQQLVPVHNNGVVPFENGQNQHSGNTTNQQFLFQFQNSNGVHIGNVNNITLKEKRDDPEVVEEQSDQKKTYKRTRTIDALIKSKKTIERRDMDLISTYLGQEWRFLFRDLGFLDGEIDQCVEENHFLGVKETIYRLLSSWKERTENPTLGAVCKILWKREIHKEVVVLLRQDYKNEKNNEEIVEE